MESVTMLEVETAKPCEVCDGALKPSFSAFGVVLTCDRCQGKFGYYYRRDGEVLTYPRAWGKLVAVVQEPEGENAALRRSGVRRAPAPPPVAIAAEGLALSTVFSPTYYVFLADDGTIRRVRLACIPKPPAGDRGVPETVTHHHRWNVDILRPAGQPVGEVKRTVVVRRVAGTRRRREARRKGGRNGQ